MLLLSGAIVAAAAAADSTELALRQLQAADVGAGDRCSDTNECRTCVGWGRSIRECEDLGLDCTCYAWARRHVGNNDCACDACVKTFGFVACTQQMSSELNCTCYTRQQNPAGPENGPGRSDKLARAGENADSLTGGSASEPGDLVFNCSSSINNLTSSGECQEQCVAMCAVWDASLSFLRSPCMRDCGDECFLCFVASVLSYLLRFSDNLKAPGTVAVKLLRKVCSAPGKKQETRGTKEPEGFKMAQLTDEHRGNFGGQSTTGSRTSRGNRANRGGGNASPPTGIDLNDTLTLFFKHQGAKTHIQDIVRRCGARERGDQANGKNWAADLMDIRKDDFVDIMRDAEFTAELNRKYDPTRQEPVAGGRQNRENWEKIQRLQRDALFHTAMKEIGDRGCFAGAKRRWLDAVRENDLSTATEVMWPWPALALAGFRAIFWHYLQPVFTAYFICFYWNTLMQFADDMHLLIAAVQYAVLVREGLYISFVTVCIFVNPAFLLVDVSASVNDKLSPGIEGGWQFFLLYVFAPEKFVALAALSKGGLSLPDKWRDKCIYAAIYLGALVDASGCIALGMWVFAIGQVPLALMAGYGTMVFETCAVSVLLIWQISADIKRKWCKDSDAGNGTEPTTRHQRVADRLEEIGGGQGQTFIVTLGKLLRHDPQGKVVSVLSSSTNGLSESLLPDSQDYIRTECGLTQDDLNLLGLWHQLDLADRMPTPSTEPESPWQTFMLEAQTDLRSERNKRDMDLIRAAGSVGLGAIVAAAVYTVVDLYSPFWHPVVRGWLGLETVWSSSSSGSSSLEDGSGSVMLENPDYEWFDPVIFATLAVLTCVCVCLDCCKIMLYRRSRGKSEIELKRNDEVDPTLNPLHRIRRRT